MLLFGGAQSVIPEQVMRSRQLSGRALENVIQRDNIRSVLNLRGRGGGQAWYAKEREVCRREGVSHTTVTFDVDEWPPRRASLRLLTQVEQLEKPVLLHCHRGVDRTGWASGVVVLAQGGDFKEGLAQLSPRFGHVCLKSRCPQHKFFASYRRWLEDNQKKQSADVFKRWLEETYCPDPWNAQMSLVGDMPTKARGGTIIELTVEVTKRGREPWLMGPSGVRLGIRIVGPLESIPDDPVAPFLDRDSPAVDLGRGDASVARMTADQTELLAIKANLPKKPGLYLVQVDMVKEHVHWFAEMGWPGIVWPVEVTES